MIISEIIKNSGQGNQMYQYALGYSLAKKNNTKLLIINLNTSGERPYVLKFFALDKKIYKVLKIHQFKNPRICNYYNKIVKKIIKCIFNVEMIVEENQMHRTYKEYDLHKNNNYYTFGYFESYKYFDEYKKDIIKQFEPIYKIDKETNEIFEQIKKCNSVALHIRRGDFEGVGRTIDINYFKKQMDKMRQMIEKPVFYLATQDEKVIEQFKDFDDVKLINCQGKNKDLNDWLCLKYCHNHIVTNSTYSWWAAYLSDYKDKIVLTMSKEDYNKSERTDKENEYDDFYPKEWRKK